MSCVLAFQKSDASLFRRSTTRTMDPGDPRSSFAQTLDSGLNPSVLFQHLVKCIRFQALIHHLLRLCIHLRGFSWLQASIYGHVAVTRCSMMFNGSTNIAHPPKIPQAFKPVQSKITVFHRIFRMMFSESSNSSLTHSSVNSRFFT